MNKMYCNIDIDSVCTPYLNAVSEKECFDKKMLYPLIDMYKGTFVTDILFCIFCQYSASDSAHFTTYERKYLQKELNGEKVDYTEEFRGIYTLNKKYNTDPYKVWIERCRELGINPWISIRMNDCHKQSFIKSDFYHEALKKGWLLGEKYGYFWDCLNYKYDIVREKMLGYIEEQINKYDVYGIELDFMHDIFCFAYLDDDNEECIDIMNNFMRKAHAIIKQAENKHGHQIKIMVRLNRDIEQSYVFGMDARTWAREKLVDIVVPSSRWCSSDSTIPLDVWKKELEGIEIPGCIEHVLTIDFGGSTMTAETARGIAASQLAKGCDGIYLFNYFGYYDVYDRDTEVHKTCGTIEEIYKHKTRCFVTGQEYETCPEGVKKYDPLDFVLTKGESKQIDICTGKIPAGKTATLMIGFEKGYTDNCKIEFNGCTLENMTNEKPIENLISEQGRWASFKVTPNDKDYQFVKFTSQNEQVKIGWLELVIE